MYLEDVSESSELVDRAEQSHYLQLAKYYITTTLQKHVGKSTIGRNSHFLVTTDFSTCIILHKQRIHFSLLTVLWAEETRPTCNLIRLSLKENQELEKKKIL